MRCYRLLFRCTVLLAFGMLTGCATTESTPKVEPITTAEVRVKFSEDQTRIALATLKEEAMRDIAARYAAVRQRDARDRRRVYVVEKILQGEDIYIGNGVRIVRLFALGHEYESALDTAQFWTYLEAIEIIGTRLHQSLRTQVGQSGERLATLEFLDLDRAALRTYQFTAQDKPCCPTRIVDTLYAWRGITLEEMR